jgi:riboflavin synthase
MFTGIIKEIGKIRAVVRRESGMEISVSAPSISPGLALGDSVSVDGVCLTVESFSKEGFRAYASAETTKSSTMKLIRKGAEVNLEPSVKAGEPMGGHIVQGHVEGLGEVVSFELKRGEGLLKIKIPGPLMETLAEKGSIALSGVSLTVSAISGTTISVIVIPYTLKTTTLKNLNGSSFVNIETDIVARQVVSYLRKKKSLTLQKLVKEGF